MSITDELREYTEKQIKWLDVSKVHYRKLFSIADRIDAEHERRMEERADRYCELRTTMKERYIELPKDADNVPWSVGDRDEDGNVVTELMLTSDGWCVFTDNDGHYRPERKRHYHTPTVEDVLREFADLVRKERVELATISEDTIAEYAAKLRLAEEGE